MRGRKCFENFVSQPVEKLVIGKMRRELAFVAVEKEKIDVGAVIQLATSELAQCENSEFRLGRTVAPAEFRVPIFEDASDANFCDLRKLPRCFLQWRHLRKLANRDARHLTAFPETKRLKTLVRHGAASQIVKLIQHFCIATNRETHLRVVKPKKSFGIPHQPRRANAGHCEKMNQGGFAQRKLFDDIDEARGSCRPLFTKLNESGFDLRRIERCRRFFSNPRIDAIHRAEHHANLAERLVGAARLITQRGEAPKRGALSPGFET